MKALSIRQPWAWLIVTGRKDVENRAWPTDFRGRFLVHAAQTFDARGYEHLRRQLGRELPARADFALGGIVGEVEIVDCVPAHPSLWFTGPWGFVLRGARPLPFRALRGRLGFFDLQLEEPEPVEDEPPESPGTAVEIRVGDVARYDARQRAMDVALIAALSRGDLMRVRDHATDRVLVEQTVARVTVEGREVAVAKRRDIARVDVARAVRPGDRVFKLAGPAVPPPPSPEPPWPEPDRPTPPVEPPGPVEPEPSPGPEPSPPDRPIPDDEPDLPDLDDFDDGGGDDGGGDNGDGDDGDDGGLGGGGGTSGGPGSGSGSSGTGTGGGGGASPGSGGSTASGGSASGTGGSSSGGSGGGAATGPWPKGGGPGG